MGNELRPSERLHLTENLLAAVVEHTEALVVVKDLQGRYLIANRSFELLLGRGRGNLVGSTDYEVLPGATADLVTRNDRETLEARAPSEFEECFQLESGRRVFLSLKVPLLTRDGTPYALCCIATDITERKRVEMTLRRHAEELAEIGRRKDEFLAMLGHELRNPLAPLRSTVELLALRGREGMTREVGILERQIRQLTRLVDDLLDMVRASSGKIRLEKTRVSLAEVIVQALETANVSDCRLDVSFPPGPVEIEGDLARLAQVVSNLLDNAARYSEPGGPIWLEARAEGMEAVVRVRDRGVGIDAALLPRVFDAFAQGDIRPRRMGGDLGLGLTVVRTLVEMHGGRVSVESGGLRMGAEFVVRLPRVPPAASQSVDSDHPPTDEKDG